MGGWELAISLAVVAVVFLLIGVRFGDRAAQQSYERRLSEMRRHFERQKG